jgi:hypothetical protein
LTGGPIRLVDRWATLLLVFGATSLPALGLAAPAARLVGGLWGDHPAGDLLLFRPGGFYLLETVRMLGRDAGAAAVLAPWVLLVVSAALLVPWSALLVALSRRGRIRPAELARLAVERLPPLAFLFGAGLFARALLLLLGYVLIDVIGRGLGGESARRETAAMAVAAAIAALLLSILRVLHDLAQAASVRHEEGAGAALLAGLDALRGRFGACMISWGWRALVATALVALAAVAAGAIGVSSGAALLAVAVVHQSTLAALVALRAAWLRDALSLVGPPAGRMSDGDGKHLDEPA